MNRFGRIASWAALVLLAGAVLSRSAEATFIVDVNQVGPNVVATGSGTIDLTGLTFVNTLSGRVPGMNPSTGVIATGPLGGLTEDFYSGVTGPTSFGSGTGASPSSGSGNLVGMHGGGTLAGELALPTGYVSDSFLSDTSTYNGATFTSLGLTPGVYTWSWGPAAADDTFVLAIGAPEPSTLAVLAVGLLGFGLLRRRTGRGAVSYSYSSRS